MHKLVEDYKEMFEKYRFLVFNLRMANDELQWKLDRATEEKQQSSFTAENLKLQIYRENKRTLEDFIKLDNIKIENEVAQQQIGYWMLYLPQNFSQGNEYQAFQCKLLLSLMLKKINLFHKYMSLKYFKDSSSSEQNQLQLLIFQTNFLLKLYALEELLDAYNISLDHAGIEIFLASGRYWDILNTKFKEIDKYLEYLCKNEIDTPRNMKSLSNTLQLFSQLLNAKFCSEQRKRIINSKCLLKMISASIKCIKDYLKFFKSLMKTPASEMKFQNLEIKCDVVVKGVNYMLNYITTEDSPKVCYDANITYRLKNVYYEISQFMELVVKIHDSVSYVDERFHSIYLFSDNELWKLNEIAAGVQMIEDSIRKSESLELCEREPIAMSALTSWIFDKKSQQEKRIGDLQSRVYFYQQKLFDANKQLAMKENKNTKPCIRKVFKENYSQTDKNITQPLSENTSSILSIKLEDMECSIKFLHFKACQIQSEQFKNRLSCLRPLKIMPKQKRYHPDVHKIIVLQKNLNKILEDLMKIVLPTVVDISSEKENQKNFRSSLLVHRELIRRDIQKKLVNLQFQFHDFKNKHYFSENQSKSSH
ncbi:dynactin subunit 1 [Caerostris darwini]|uniref:Dynactin subunit 1 n=1 Tax=Caerostris darwini TaxID=1538125 RepID=A0AAV4NN48_9ARAC|nr:dynactin subunit 1 [Caerostris darwini]